MSRLQSQFDSYFEQVATRHTALSNHWTFLLVDLTLDLESKVYQPLLRIAKTVNLEAAPIHQTEEQTTHATVRSIEVVKRAAAAKFAASATEQDHR